MLLVYRCHIHHGTEGLSRPMLRYGLLRRLAASAGARDVQILAFGLGDDEVRLVLEGAPLEVANVVRGTKGGTSRAARAWDVLVLWGHTERRELAEHALPEVVAWCHAVGPGRDPLASPWTSHRDLLGFRRADFFDARALRSRVDPADVHRRAGGGALPKGPDAVDDAELDQLLRVAAAVVGVLPANRRCFRLFVHLARTCGWRTEDLAHALMLTGRRIRQLAQGEEPLLPLALVHLTDDRLCRVP